MLETRCLRCEGVFLLVSLPGLQLFLLLMGQNGDRGLPGGKPHWGPAGRSALDRALKGL